MTPKKLEMVSPCTPMMVKVALSATKPYMHGCTLLAPPTPNVDVIMGFPQIITAGFELRQQFAFDSIFDEAIRCCQCNFWLLSAIM
jgi:hypothetical protein